MIETRTGTEFYLFRVVDVNEDAYWVQANDAAHATDILLDQDDITFAEDVITVERICAYSEIITDKPEELVDEDELDILEA